MRLSKQWSLPPKLGVPSMYITKTQILLIFSIFLPPKINWVISQIKAMMHTTVHLRRSEGPLKI